MQVEKISDTIQKFNGVSYYRCGPYFQRKGKRLHRTVWEFHNGPIPEGHDVHHVNGDRADNDIGNLQLMESGEHHSVHMREPARIEKSRESLTKARERAKAWHGSKDGAQFHSEHAKTYWENAEPRTYLCTYCKKEFQTTHIYGPGENTFCCATHKAYWRKAQGIDNEARTCPICGKTFSVNRYAKQICCSQECARKRRWGK